MAAPFALTDMPLHRAFADTALALLGPYAAARKEEARMNVSATASATALEVMQKYHKPVYSSQLFSLKHVALFAPHSQARWIRHGYVHIGEQRHGP